MNKLLIIILLSFIITGCAAKKPVGLSAEEAYKVGIEAEIEGHFKKGVELFKGGRYDKAALEFQKVLEREPAHSRAYNNLAIIYKKTGELEKAIKEYEKAVSLDPYFYDAQNNLGIAYREAGNFEKAETAYKLAIASEPGIPEAYLNIGVLYDLYLNKKAEAMYYYEKYLELAGENKKVQEWIEDIKNRL